MFTLEMLTVMCYAYTARLHRALTPIARFNIIFFPIVLMRMMIVH